MLAVIKIALLTREKILHDLGKMTERKECRGKGEKIQETLEELQGFFSSKHGDQYHNKILHVYEGKVNKQRMDLFNLKSARESTKEIVRINIIVWLISLLSEHILIKT